MRIGCVKYLNARPLIHGWPGTVILDHPVALCRRLAEGELDVALVSSFEFLRNPIYRIVDNISISADGPVYSVVVAHAPNPPPTEIELDPASVTSAALLRCLTAERSGKFKEGEFIGDMLSPLAPPKSRLLIGDQALRFRRRFGNDYQYWDLGEEWKRTTGLPFVFALWLVRPETEKAGTLGDQLRQLRDRNLQSLAEVAADQKDFDPDFCRRYYSDNLRFTFGERERQGLQEFADACAKLGLIQKRRLEFQLV